jgi:hypothetical protein
MLWTYNLTMLCVYVFLCVHMLQNFSILNQLNMGSKRSAKDKMQSSEIIYTCGQTDGWTDGRIF